MLARSASSTNWKLLTFVIHSHRFHSDTIQTRVMTQSEIGARVFYTRIEQIDIYNVH